MIMYIYLMCVRAAVLVQVLVVLCNTLPCRPGVSAYIIHSSVSAWMHEIVCRGKEAAWLSHHEAIFKGDRALRERYINRVLKQPQDGR
jgi:hypothetical protein